MKNISVKLFITLGLIINFTNLFCAQEEGFDLFVKEVEESFGINPNQGVIDYLQQKPTAEKLMHSLKTMDAKTASKGLGKKFASGLVSEATDNVVGFLNAVPAGLFGTTKEEIRCVLDLAALLSEHSRLAHNQEVEASFAATLNQKLSVCNQKYQSLALKVNGLLEADTSKVLESLDPKVQKNVGERVERGLELFFIKYQTISAAYRSETEKSFEKADQN